MGKEKYDNFYHYNRNYGCRFHEITYRGFNVIVLENEKLRLSLYLDKGTDIFELLYKPKDIDFMWRSPLEISARSRTPLTKEFDIGAFLDEYEGGWQELLPNITAPSNYKGANFGFHGELYLLPWRYRVIEDSPYTVTLEFYVRMKRAPLFVTKSITLKSGSSVIDFKETIINEADEDFSFMWGHHPAIGKPFLDENCVIDLPTGAVGQIYQADFSGNSPFEVDKEFKWPMIEDVEGKEVDLSKVMSPDKKIAFNTYIKELNSGWYGLTNLEKGIGFGMIWDINIFKYMLIWSVYRGFYNFPFYGRTYNIALELYSAIPDSLDEAVKLGRDLKLGPGETLATEFSTVIYESDKRIKGFDDQKNIIN